MNERIKELLQESYTHFGQGKYRTPELVAEKFAQLIVKECANEIQLFTNELSGEYYVGFNIGLVLASKIIEQHFGVEE